MWYPSEKTHESKINQTPINTLSKKRTESVPGNKIKRYINCVSQVWDKDKAITGNHISLSSWRELVVLELGKLNLSSRGGQWMYTIVLTYPTIHNKNWGMGSFYCSFCRYIMLNVSYSIVPCLTGVHRHLLKKIQFVSQNASLITRITVRSTGLMVIGRERTTLCYQKLPSVVH